MAAGRPGPRKLALALDAGELLEGATDGNPAIEDPAGSRARGLTSGDIVEGGAGGCATHGTDPARPSHKARKDIHVRVIRSIDLPLPYPKTRCDTLDWRKRPSRFCRIKGFIG